MEFNPLQWTATVEGRFADDFIGGLNPNLRQNSFLERGSRERKRKGLIV
jgi:hypothetical protein